jgi:hypothetical protein
MKTIQCRMPVYFLPWDIVMYQIESWKTHGDIVA